MRALINGVLGSKNVMLLASSNWCLFDDYAFECFSKFDYVDCLLLRCCSGIDDGESCLLGAFL